MNIQIDKKEQLSGTGRTGSRQLLLQVFYQRLINNDHLDVLVQQSKDRKEYARIDQEYFEILLQEMIDNQENIEQLTSAHLDRSIEQVNPVEKIIIWIAACEILFHNDVPVPVVINEAVELAKLFGAEGSFQYVNAVIDAFQNTHSRKG
jgi:N utilization substance protein B